MLRNRRAHEWCTDEGNIERDIAFSRKALNPWKSGKGSNTREYCVGRYWERRQTTLRQTGSQLSQQLTFPASTIYRLGKFYIVKWYLFMVMPVVMGFNANNIKQQGDGRENL